MTPRTGCRFIVSLYFLLLLPAAQAGHVLSPWLEYVGAYPVYPAIDYGSGEQAAAIRRGEYLAKIGDCIACHTSTEDGSPAFAGGLPIPTPFGTFYTPNITPDLNTGLGQWTAADFIRAMHDGIRADGSNAFPAFPYTFFNRVTDKDLRDIWAYLQALPPVVQANRDNTLPFPLDVRLLQYGWKILFFYPDRGEWIDDPSRSSAWNRGAYLVEGLGHCSMCHTPMNMLGAQQQRHYLGGAMINGYWAPDISSKGLETASRFQVGKVFSQGKLINQAGAVRGPMADVVHDSLRYLTGEDRLAIAAYLKSVESRPRADLPARLARQPPLKRGQQVYARACILCHLDGAAGAPRLGDNANWERRIRDNGLSVLYRNALDGFNNMPPRGACVSCNDADVIAAVDYMVHQALDESEWKELQQPPPQPRKQVTGMAIGKRIYAQSCSRCHEKGLNGAPMTGDQAAWAPRLKKNFDVLLNNALRGINAMPAKGGCEQCTGTEIIAATKYMVQQSQTVRDLSLW